MHHGTVVDAHEVDKRRLRVAHHPVDFHVRDGGVHHGALGLELVDGEEFEFEALGFFKTQVARGLHHRFLQRAFHLSEVALQHMADGRDAVVVGLFRLLAHAGPHAVADVVFQAHPKLAFGDVVLRQGQAAGANGVELLAEVEHGVHALDVGVGPKIFAPVFPHLTGGKDAGEALLLENDERVCLVVFELDVVDRLVLFDHVVLQQQGVGLARGHDPLHIPNLLHQQPRLAVVVLLGEVAGDAFFEVLRLADVQQFPVPIEVLIDARFMGHPVEDRLDVVGGRHR